MKDLLKNLIKNGRQAVGVTLIFMLVCGFAFPLTMTAIGGLLFPYQAGGSIITVNDVAVGSEIVGQEFKSDYFLYSRPSACHYNVYAEDENGNYIYSDGSAFAGLSSGSFNYGPSNPLLLDRMENDLELFLKAHPYLKREDIPADILTASGSGLDPHISPEAARVQVQRIAQNSGLSEETVNSIIADNTKGKLMGIFGEETVNVLGVNIDIASAMGIIGEN